MSSVPPTSCRQSKNRATWQARLSVAYLQAIASEVCCNFAEVVPDTSKIDVTLTNEVVRIPLSIQLKTIVGTTPGTKGYSLSIEKELHDTLRQPDPYPRLLALLVLPPDSDDWLELDSDALKLKRCMYWLSLRGERAVTTASVTVHFPVSQQLTPARLREMYIALSKGDLDGAFK